MKPWQAVILAVCCIGAFFWGLTTIGDMWIRSKDADRSDWAAHRKLCREGRKTFFEDCYAWGRGRFEYEMLWAQRRDRVFDGEPSNAWVDEIDCSPEIK